MKTRNDYNMYNAKVKSKSWKISKFWWYLSKVKCRWLDSMTSTSLAWQTFKIGTLFSFQLLSNCQVEKLYLIKDIFGIFASWGLK